MKEYYDSEYFTWQKKSGLLTSKLSLFKFKRFINKTSNVLEFGCGGGFLLDKIEAQQKIGIEINRIALIECKNKGLDVYTNIEDIQDNWADIVISNHVLEHVESPLDELKKLKMKMKTGGKIIFVVPNEKVAKYDKNDINKHLYTWTELNLGNLFHAAGFSIIKVEELKHRWFPFVGLSYKFLGGKVTHFLCYIYGYIFNNLSQIRIIAEKI